MKKFIDNHFEFCKGRAILGLLIGIGLLAYGYTKFTSFHYALFFASIFILSSALRIKVKSNKTAFVLYLLWGVIAALGLAYFSQYTMKFGAFREIGSKNIMLEMLIIGITFMIFFFITQRMTLSAGLTAGLLDGGSVANFFVYAFRGNELMPTDLISMGTAANVAGNMAWRYPDHVHYAIVGAACLAFITLSLPKWRKPEVKPRFNWLKKRLITLAVLIPMIMVWSSQIDTVRLRLYGRNPTRGNGFLVSFTAVLKTTFKDLKPEDYSTQVIADLETKYKTKENTSKEKPDIIVVMDEAFSDLDVVGDIKTEEEIMPNFKSLKENTTRGYAFTSVIGGGTCTTEFEFLTGHTNGFLPTGITAYQSYVNKPTYSCVTELENFGYTTFATHPFKGNGYMRNRAYPNLGFDSMSFMEDYPQKKLVRQYVGDQEMFEFLINHWKKRDKSKPYFSFGVTMQNHSMFDYTGDGYTPVLKLKKGVYKREYHDVEQYLGLIHESDKAFGYLIDYFKKVDHPVVICMFGDHFPRVSSSFFDEIHGGTLDEKDLQQMALKYQVPFVVWTNYKTKSRDVGLVSISQMMDYVYESAGLESPYRNFLTDLHNVVPAYSAQGYYSKSQNQFVPIDEATGEEKKWLEKYRALQYNALFDKKNKSKIFFPLPEVNE